MQKYLLLLWLLFLISCKKDNVNELYTEDQLIGKWIYNELKINGVLYNYQHQPGCKKDRFYFMNRPGQDHDYTELIYLNSNCASSGTNMDWKLLGENLFLNFGSQIFRYKILKLNATNLDLSIQIDYDKDGKADNIEIYAIKEPCVTGEPSYQ